MPGKFPTRAQSEKLEKRVVHIYKNIFNKDSKNI